MEQIHHYFSNILAWFFIPEKTIHNIWKSKQGTLILFYKDCKITWNFSRNNENTATKKTHLGNCYKSAPNKYHKLPLFLNVLLDDKRNLCETWNSYLQNVVSVKFIPFMYFQNKLRPTACSILWLITCLCITYELNYCPSLKIWQKWLFCYHIVSLINKLQ